MATTTLNEREYLNKLRRLKQLRDKETGKTALTLQPAHEPFQPKPEPFLERFGKKLAVPFEAIGKGLAESKYVQPIEGGGLAGEISNILAQPTRLAGQL